MSDNLGQLFVEARHYGLVDLSTLDGGTYSCTILVALEDREIKAKSGFMHLTPHSAVKAAIKVAQAISSAAQNTVSVSNTIRIPELQLV